MFYLNTSDEVHGLLLNDETIRAFHIADQIDDWMDRSNSSGIAPLASITVTGGYLQISIGDISVWDSESRDGDEELTLEVCLRNYREHLDDLRSPFEPDETVSDEVEETPAT